MISIELGLLSYDESIIEKIATQFWKKWLTDLAKIVKFYLSWAPLQLNGISEQIRR